VGRRLGARSEPDNGPVGEPRWLISFNDLMTLLLTFFILLFALSGMDAKKMKMMQKGLQSALGVLEKGGMSKINLVPPVAEAPREQVNRPEEEKGTAVAVPDLVKGLEGEPGVGVSYTAQRVVIELKDAILFESGNAEVSVGAFPVLDKVAEVIRQFSDPVLVEGHTDNVPISTGRYPSNWELSTARAVGVVKYFVERTAIAPERFGAAGYGASRLLVGNDTPDDRAQNRRVEIVLELGKKEAR
jgi:chemotaxis protein MotB